MIDWRVVRTIMRKDLREIGQNRMVLLPMILVPMLILVVLPSLAMLVPSLAGELIGAEMDDMWRLLEILPPSVASEYEGLNDAQLWVMFSASFFFAPMFLIAPLMVSSVVAADSFVGEKERKTLEGLLYTPATDTELFLGKLLTSVVPALGITWASFVVYGILVNALGWPVMGRIFFPTSLWWILAFWLGPAVAGLGMGVTVLISIRAKTFMGAQQASGALVLPIVFLMVGQVGGLFYFGPTMAFLVGLVLWAVDAVLIWLGSATFRRGELIARL